MMFKKYLSLFGVLSALFFFMSYFQNASALEHEEATCTAHQPALSSPQSPAENDNSAKSRLVISLRLESQDEAAYKKFFKRCIDLQAACKKQYGKGRDADISPSESIRRDVVATIQSGI